LLGCAKIYRTPASFASPHSLVSSLFLSRIEEETIQGELTVAKAKSAVEGLSDVLEDKNPARTSVQIKAPDLRTVIFHVRGVSPLVIHRFSVKTKEQMARKMEEGKSAGSKKNREAKNSDDTFFESRYISKEGWDGFHAASIRNAMISACRLVGFKMTLAKMSIFVLQDGWDKVEPQIPLIRIIGKAVKQADMARVETGAPYVTYRASYNPWEAKIRIRFDADQFSITDVSHLLSRVGMQVGIGEGRHDSKNSCGMGWGCFSLEGVPQEKPVQEVAA